MSFGTTSGRGFETEFAPYAYAAILLITLCLWLVFHLDIRKRDREVQQGQDSEE